MLASSFVAVRYAGATYLLYVAWKLWTAPIRPPDMSQASPEGGLRVLTLVGFRVDQALRQGKGRPWLWSEPDHVAGANRQTRCPASLWNRPRINKHIASMQRMTNGARKCNVMGLPVDKGIGTQTAT